MSDDHNKLTFDDFRKRAKDADRSVNEKIGFPDSYRSGTEEAIFSDILAKLPVLLESGKTIIDIGCGCGPLARLMMAYCAEHDHRLIMVDSAEMLRLLPRVAHTELRAQRFPKDAAFLDEFRGTVDALLLYSVIQHEFMDGNLWSMIDALCGLLTDGGLGLIGDVPNRSMRTRLFNSPNGIAFHRKFTGTTTDPPIPAYGLIPGEIDDSVVLAILARARAQGIHGYVLPQPRGLPFFNRREDILLEHP